MNDNGGDCLLQFGDVVCLVTSEGSFILNMYDHGMPSLLVAVNVLWLLCVIYAVKQSGPIV